MAAFALLVSWGFKYDLDKSEWASWVQAVGSIVALLFAFLLGERQAKATLEGVREANRIDARRRYDAIVALAESAEEYTSRIGAIFHDGGFGYLELKIKYQESIMLDLIDALKSVSALDLGSYNAIFALASLRTAMVDFKGNVDRARADLEKHKNEERNSYPPWHTWNATALELCTKQVARAAQGLRDHRPPFAR